MAIVGISITKEVPFRDSVQPFSNMYFYNNGLGGAPTASEAQNMLQELVAIEKTLHSSGVEFVFGRIWLQALTEIGSTMLHQAMQSGNGTATATTMDKERAYLFRRRAGQDSRGQPVYLRKWYHTCGVFPGHGGTSVASGVTENTSGFTDAARTAMANAMQTISSITAGGGGWQICSKGGRAPTEPNWVCHRYLEHHQLGDQWRGA